MKLKNFLKITLLTMLTVTVCFNSPALALSKATLTITFADSNEAFSVTASDIIKRYDCKNEQLHTKSCTENHMLRIMMKAKVDGYNIEKLQAVEVVKSYDNRYILQYNNELDLQEDLTLLKNDSRILYAIKDEEITANYLEDSESKNLSWGTSAIEADIYSASIATNVGGESIKIAIVDSGAAPIDFIAQRLVQGYDFVDNDIDTSNDIHKDSHGTFLSSIIVDCTPDVPVMIMPIRVLSSTTGSLINAINGIMYAVDNGADVINISLGGKIRDCQALDDAIDYAHQNDVTVVACSGNERGDTSDYCPAHNETALTVSAVDSSLTFANRFSNYGNSVDVTAPGVDINGYNAKGAEITLTGTSMSTAFISAAVALYRLDNPHCTSEQVEMAIKNCSLDLGDTGWDPEYGYGLPKLSKIEKLPVVEVSDIYLNEQEIVIDCGETFKLNCTIEPDNATFKDVIWRSGDTSIATVDSNGIVTGIKGGKTVITVQTTDGKKEASCTVKVAECKKELVLIRIDAVPSKASYNYKVDTSLDGLNVVAVYSDGSEVDVTGQVKVTGFDTSSTGNKTATVEFEGKTATFDYTVSYAWWQWIIRILLFGWIWY